MKAFISTTSLIIYLVVINPILYYAITKGYIVVPFMASIVLNLLIGFLITYNALVSLNKKSISNLLNK